MGTFLGAPDVEESMDAGVAVGIYDELTIEALATMPGVVWDTANPPTNATYLRDAARRAFNNVGLFDEKADQMVAALGTGLTGAVTIPNVVGMLLPAATTALLAAGLRLGPVTEVANAEPATEVITQDPVAGASEVFVRVTLEVSDGSL